MMTKQCACFVILAGLAILNPVAVSAATIGITPAAQTVSLGGTFQVNAIISGLTTSRVGDFDVTMSFDRGLLQVTDVSFGSFLGSPSSLQSFTLGTDHAEFAEVSLLAASDLIALQPHTFTPATLTFRAIGIGTSALSFTAITAGDQTGVLLDLIPTGGSVAVSGVPEPGSAWLVLAGICLFACWCLFRSLVVQADRGALLVRLLDRRRL